MGHARGHVRRAPAEAEGGGVMRRDLDYDGPPPDDLSWSEVAGKLLHDLLKAVPFAVGGWAIGAAIAVGLSILLGF